MPTTIKDILLLLAGTALLIAGIGCELSTPPLAPSATHAEGPNPDEEGP